MQPDGRLPRLNRDEMANQDGKGWVNMGKGGGAAAREEGGEAQPSQDGKWMELMCVYGGGEGGRPLGRFSYLRWWCASISVDHFLLPLASLLRID